MNLEDRFLKLKETVPATVKIIAVSKTKPVNLIEELYRKTGHTYFGENKAQELNTKHEMLPADISWHFIGHLQTNKIKYIAPYVSMIQSVDSMKLLLEINKEAEKHNRVIPCLLQFYIAEEDTKFGFSIQEATAMIEDSGFRQLTNISVAGVMGMATFTKNKKQIHSEFKKLFGFFTQLKSTYFSGSPEFCEISMGMSDDYQIAVDEGSTMIRIGSGIFGDR